MSRAQLFVIISAVALLLVVLEMVRRRRLREEYSWLWLLTAVGYLAVAVFSDLSMMVANLLGSVNPVSAFTFLGFLFLFLISIQFSIQISRLASQNKDLVQHVAILDAEIKKLMKTQESGESTYPEEDVQGNRVGSDVEQREGVEQSGPVHPRRDVVDRLGESRPVATQPATSPATGIGPALPEID